MISADIPRTPTSLVQPAAAFAGHYDLIPYPSLPFAYTQPSHLAALACLYGLDAPPAERARVLELGCASGGNIIPLAARFPGAHFLGIDLSQRQVSDGCRRIAQLGLGNIELWRGDIEQVSLPGQQFDYVICHGVFSWVPKQVQDRILQLCAEVLSPDGLAVVSYNVLPGWHLRSVIRDMCLHHVSVAGSAGDRVSRVRALLTQIADGASDSHPYGLLLRREAARIVRLPASYVLGEFLAPHNHPLYFHDFAGRAASHGLSFLCEGDVGSSIAETLFPGTAKTITGLAGKDRVAFEQYKDFFSGRPFRRSVLRRTDASVALAAPSPDRLRSLHLASKLRFTGAARSGDVSVYLDAQGRSVQAKDAIVSRALARLAAAYPDTRTLEGLLHPGDTEEAASRVSHAVFALVAAGQATVSTLPLRAGQADAPHPVAWRVARAEAAAGQPWVTTLRHEAVPLDPATARLLPLLDGTRDLHTQRLRPVEEQASQSYDSYLARLLDSLAANAILEPE